jgi:hypothetical protein
MFKPSAHATLISSTINLPKLMTILFVIDGLGCYKNAIKFHEMATYFNHVLKVIIIVQDGFLLLVFFKNKNIYGNSNNHNVTTMTEGYNNLVGMKDMFSTKHPPKNRA